MFKPMKPASQLVSPLDMKKWPKLGSIKYDGIRGVSDGEMIRSNSLKPIPNKFIQEALAELPAWLDGELVLRGDEGKLYDNNQSAFMSRTGQPDFVFKVFDYAALPTAPFSKRLAWAQELCEKFDFVESVDHKQLIYPQEAIEWYDEVRVEGYEGLILRDPNSPYKFGRSTVNQEMGMKMKPYDPDEAVVIGFAEMFHNDNEQYKNEMGYSVRSAHQDNKTASGVLGSLICDYKGREFRIGTGFDMELRTEIWNNQDKYLNKLVRFKHQGITKSGVPRGPAVYLGWRDEIDMGLF